jgi:DNA-binding CsgD family transcriptional regulator
VWTRGIKDCAFRMKPGPHSTSGIQAAGGLSSNWDALARTLWEALAHDATAEILILTPQGRIAFANRDAETFFGAEHGSLNGSQYRDLYPEQVATERLGYIADVARTNTPMVIEGIIRGSWRQTTLRFLPATEPLVLLINKPIGEPIAGQVTHGVRARHDDLGVLGSLTTREREILALIGRGLSTVEIARSLGRSVKTVEWHRVSLGTKLGVTNRVELAHIALRSGLAAIGSAGTPIQVQVAAETGSKEPAPSEN